MPQIFCHKTKQTKHFNIENITFDLETKKKLKINKMYPKHETRQSVIYMGAGNGIVHI